jgi:hypothetical protein
MQLEFEHIIKLAYPDMPSIFTDKQLETVNNIIKYHDYYDGNSFKYVVQQHPEYGKQGRFTNSYNPTQLTINYIRKIIDKLTAFQFEKSIDITVTAAADTKKANGQADDVQEYLYDWHKRNQLDLKHLQAAKEHNITGGVAYKLLPDEVLGEARPYIRERLEVYPVVEFDDYEKIDRVHFVAFIDEKTIWKQTFEMAGGICYWEVATYDARDIAIVKEKIVKWQPLVANGNKLDFMPVYIIPNLPMLGEVFGLSEVKDLTCLQDEINRKYSDLGDSLRFEMFAITIMMNAEFGDNEKVTTKPGAVWRLMGGDKEHPIGVEKLESKFQYIESLRYHLESMKSLLFELSDVIQLEGKQIESVGQLSGVALRMLFANMISKINQKNTIWVPILERMYADAAKIRSYYGKLDIPNDMIINITPHVPVPLNEKEQIEIIVQKLSFNLMSIKAAMNELGVENEEMMIKEILDEQKTFEQALSQYSDANEVRTSEG